MKRPFKPLLIFAALTLALGATFGARAGTASADWGDEDKLLPVTNTLKTLLKDHRKASIELRHCEASSVASWKSKNLTFQIVDDGVGADLVRSVRSGVLAWNNVNSGYTLTEKTSGKADISITISRKLLVGNTLGVTNVTCAKSGPNIESARIVINAQGLTPLGIRTVASHEAGHALGLGHSDHLGDLMNGRFDLLLNSLTVTCPSNLDIAGLSSKSDPFSMDSAKVTAPKSC